MLREKDVKKYKKKTKYEHILFLRKDGEYLLKNERPIKDNLIKTINQEKVSKFIDDILVNKKISRQLFRSNSDFEINNYLNIKQRFFTHKSPLKPKIIDNITVKQIKKQACLDMKKAINNYKENRTKLIKSMDKINKRKIRIFTKELCEMKNSSTQDIKNNRINGFIRSYNSIRKKFDFYKNGNSYKNNSCVLNENKILYDNKQNNKLNNNKNNLMLKSISNDRYGNDTKSNKIKNKKILNKTHLPDTKLDENDVFSRLYYNVVHLSPSALIKHKRPHSCVNQNQKFNSLSYDFQNNTAKKPKIIFKVNKAIKSTAGKEFTFRLTKSMLKKCFIKYSGGPPVLKMNLFKNEKEENKKDYVIKENSVLQSEEDDYKKPDFFVNYFKLIDKRNGNSFLHLAVLGGYEELVRYLLEKKSNINLKNYDGNTPLHLALLNKEQNENIIDILMEYNPRLDIKNNNNEIAFDLFTYEMKVKYEIDSMIIDN